MGRRRALRPSGPRRPSPRTALLAVAALATAGVVLVGTLSGPGPELSAGGGGDPSSSEQAATGPAADAGSVDVSNLPIERGPFCDRIDDTAVPTALGRQVGTREHYTSGDLVPLAGGRTDVSHEFGCVFGAGDAEARAWVFVVPVTAADARALVDEALRDPDCDYPTDGPGYGRPGLTSVCERSGGRLEVTHRGRFGDAWLSCRLTLPRVEVAPARVRADQWCLHVATTLGSAD